jgi:hypothetical protein
MKLIAILILLFPFLAAAGVMSGGGGKGVVCRDAEQKITSVELLDLWEARTLYANTPVMQEKDLQSGVFAAVERLKNSYFYYGRYESSKTTCKDQDCVAEFLRNFAKPFLSESPSVLRLHGVTLTLTDDSYEAAHPENCAVEQM